MKIGALWWVMSSLASTPLTGVLIDPVDRLVKEHEEFASALYLEDRMDRIENQLVSPYSVATVLSMLYMGARGETADEIEEVLHTEWNQTDLSKAYRLLSKEMGSLAKTGSSLCIIASALWVDESVYLLSSFQGQIEGAFQGKVQRLSFANASGASGAINAWIQEKTEGKIATLLEPGDISAATRLVATNALFFKGGWRYPFAVENTVDGVFHVSLEEDVKTPLMTGTFSVGYFENDVVQILALPFKEIEAQCVVMVPKSAENLEMIENDWMSHFDAWKRGQQLQTVQLTLPRLVLKERIDLQNILGNMGMKLAFTTQANFVGIDGKLDLYLSKVITEAYLALNETGVIAAAATAAGMNLKAAPIPAQTTVVADHPFLILITDSHRSEVLLMGKCVRPNG